MKYPEEHKWLSDLPVAKSIDSNEYSIDENFCLVAATGSGKTMVIGPAIVQKTGRKVVIRQPTRQIAWLVYKSLKEFWGSELNIGIRTSERSVGEFEENDITVVTDGVMRSLLKKHTAGLTVIFDEAHWMHEPTEIELGIVKTHMNDGHDIKCVLLSATIRPENFLGYFENLNKQQQSKAYISKVCDDLVAGSAVNKREQTQFMKCYYAEGVIHDVKRFIIHDDNDKAIKQFCERMKQANTRGLVFLTTRAEVASNARKWNKELEIPTEFCHADRNIDEVVKFVQETEGCVLFATVSMATSATLPFDEVLIIDRGLESDWSTGVSSLKTNVPIDNNGVIQRAGRVGRTKPGIAYLNTLHKKGGNRYNFGQDWVRSVWEKDIVPVPIKPPLESLPLDMVVVTCAAFKLNLKQIDLLSDLSMMEIVNTAKFLQNKGILEVDDFGNSRLTALGNRINGMQLGVWSAYSLCMAEKELLPALLASKVMSGPFGLFYATKNQDGSWANGKDKWMTKYPARFKSISGFKAWVFAQACQVKKSELYDWCQENNMKYKSVKWAIDEFKKLANKSLNKNAKQMIEMLKGYNQQEIDSMLAAHTKKFGLQRKFSLRYSDKWGFNTEVDGVWATCSKDETELLDMPYGSYATVHASPKKITTKTGKTMMILEDITVVNYR